MSCPRSLVDEGDIEAAERATRPTRGGHYRRSGGMKLSYQTEAQARAAARSLRADIGLTARAYPCRDRRYPAHWHITTTPPLASRPARPCWFGRWPELAAELGPRALGCLVVENYTSGPRRAFHLRQRFVAARRRAQVQGPG